MNSRLLLFLTLVLIGVLNCGAAIVHPKAPVGGQKIVVKYVSQMLKEYPDGPVLAEPGLKIADVSVAEPFGLYYVGLTNLATGKLLSAAASSSWQYLLLHGTNAVGAATLQEVNEKLIVTGLYETDFSRETLEALRIAGHLPQTKQQDYEIRRLDCPSVLFIAVWLHATSDDIIIPLPPTFGRWRAYQPYSEKQMLKLLKPEAKKTWRKPPGFGDWDNVAPTIIVLILLSIPISAAVRLIMAQVSPQVRQSVARHPVLHLIWLAAAIAVIVLSFLLPPLR